MIDIPKNTYSVDCEKEVEEVISKCIERIEKYGSVLIDRHPLNEHYRKDNVCVDHDSIGYEVVNHFIRAGYHGAVVYFSGSGSISEFEISKKPIEERYNKRILG